MPIDKQTYAIKINFRLYAKSTDEDILLAMVNNLPSIKAIINSANEAERDQICQDYDGLYYFLKLLEKISMDISDGKIKV